jgi:hypothetical protein
MEKLSSAAKYHPKLRSSASVFDGHFTCSCFDWVNMLGFSSGMFYGGFKSNQLFVLQPERRLRGLGRRVSSTLDEVNG